MTKDRARGALLGLAVGDALGTTYEFEPIAQPPFPALATGPATDVVGRGPFGLLPGQVTDDTHLAVCLARSLAACGGLDIADVARRYVAWSDHTFDIGAQTRASIDRLRSGEPGTSAGLGVWRASERRPAGNGSLMRTAPIGVAYARPNRALVDPALIDAAIGDSMITHADPRCALACAAFDAAIAGAIDTQLDGPAMLEIARANLRGGAQRLRSVLNDPTDVEHVERALVDLEGDLAAATTEDPGVYAGDLHMHRSQGFVRVAFRIAFWHAVHTRSWPDAVVDVASRGGDADTNTAIVGALLGARDGEAAIPQAWVLRVLGATQPGPAAWADDHHPRHLLQLVRE